MALHLVRHGRPLVRPDVPAHRWDLDPAAYDDVWALRTSGRLPERAEWYSSPEPKARSTAALLTDGEVGVVDDLAEHRRGSGWIDDFEAVVRRAFADPDRAAYPGWEPLADCRRRVVAAARPLLPAAAGGDVVLVGHGTAWTLLVAEVTGAEPDVEAWQALAMPDLLRVEGPFAT